MKELTMPYLMIFVIVTMLVITIGGAWELGTWIVRSFARMLP